MRRTMLAAGAASLFAWAMPARADEQTVKLIQLLIQKGILSSGQAKDLLRETAAAPRGHRRAAAAAADGSDEAPAAAPGEVRVTYVPQFIRKQIADQVRSEVMTQAQAEGWAAPDALPEWTRRFQMYGDLRFRYEQDLFDPNNYNQFVNFSAINNGAPYDIEAFGRGTGLNPPFLNTTEDRNRFRLRARLGFKAFIDDGVTADFRIGTGGDNSPVSVNQTLGAPGDFSKYNLWLDRAYFTLQPFKALTVYAGRANSPFVGSDLMFKDDLGFDGIGAQYKYPIGGALGAFVNAGAFPIFNTSFDFSTNSPMKYGSKDAYLLGVQWGLDWKINQTLAAEIAIGGFSFNNIQGSVSAPCNVQPGGAFYCTTDNTKAPFLQFGNTVYAIRNIVQPPGLTTLIDPQYFGLASRFNVLDVHPRIDLTSFHPIDVALEGEFIKNLSYNRTAILNHGPLNGPVGPQNNFGSCDIVTHPGCVGPYQGGDTGYMVKLALGQLKIHKRWDWNAYVTYRYLESDATPDAFDDSDFHLGGTNAQGYQIGGTVGVARNTWMQFKWASAQAIAGPHYGVDVFQLDLQSNF